MSTIPIKRAHRGTAEPHQQRDHWREQPQVDASAGRRALLVALHERLTRAVFEDERTQPRDLSALTARLLVVAAELDALDQAADREAALSGDDQARADRRRRYEGK